MIIVSSPTRKITWHPCRKISFKCLFNIYSGVKPNIVRRRVEKESGCRPTCPSYSSKVQKSNSVPNLHTLLSETKLSFGCIRPTLTKWQLVIKYQYPKPRTTRSREGALLTTAFSISLRCRRCCNAPVMLPAAAPGTSRGAGSAPGARPRASEHP